MANSLFIKADEVAELLGVSRAETYRIIKRLNDECRSGTCLEAASRLQKAPGPPAGQIPAHPCIPPS